MTCPDEGLIMADCPPSRAGLPSREYIKKTGHPRREIRSFFLKIRLKKKKNCYV
jgi:hypothetical protein